MSDTGSIRQSEDDGAGGSMGGDGKRRSRWMLPIGCGVVLLAILIGWCYPRMQVMSVLRREEAVGNASFQYQGLPPHQWVRSSLLGDCWPGLEVTFAILRDDHGRARGTLQRLAATQMPGMKSASDDAAWSQTGRSGVGPLKALNQLYLRGAGYSDADMPCLGAFRRLEKVEIVLADVTGENFPVLTQLAELTVVSNKVSDKGMARLAALPSIVKLYVAGENITLKGIEEALKTASPTLQYLNMAPNRQTRADPSAVESLMRSQPLPRKLGFYKAVISY